MEDWFTTQLERNDATDFTLDKIHLLRLHNLGTLEQENKSKDFSEDVSKLLVSK